MIMYAYCAEQVSYIYSSQPERIIVTGTQPKTYSTVATFSSKFRNPPNKPGSTDACCRFASDIASESSSKFASEMRPSMQYNMNQRGTTTGKTLI